ncbi:testis-expressed protein 47-like [Pararge aegeria]|uniref:Jg17977 protein n=1 Tax=Pararge aegeria aegeria TaxID=348720 RepID=A0A8S4S548_9NEOP|nr:testis-expressed protein 47-like [Pararge aegeria]CAH2244503.1 jg17977 [Pararge aegeria aegeria]
MALLPDLDVRNVLNVVEENFERLGLKAYAIRMIYTGEHVLDKDEMIKLFQATINSVNSSYSDVNVRGLLLVYDSYFVHVVEGSEDTVHTHLRFLFEHESKWIKEKFKEDEIGEADEGVAEILDEQLTQKCKKKIFKRAKLLTVYHSIQTLLFDDWRALTARPPSLIGALDAHGSMSEQMEQLRICLDKIKRICAYAKGNTNLSFEGLSAVDPKMEALPEVALIDYLLQSQYILDLRYVSHLHRRVDDYAFYFENVWPLPTHFTPKHLYKLKVDDSFVEPLPVMPWELVKKEAEEEEREDRQSVSSSSD